jgi:hypothetical protein
LPVSSFDTLLPSTHLSKTVLPDAESFEMQCLPESRAIITEVFGNCTYEDTLLWRQGIVFVIIIRRAIQLTEQPTYIQSIFRSAAGFLCTKYVSINKLSSVF